MAISGAGAQALPKPTPERVAKLKGEIEHAKLDLDRTAHPERLEQKIQYMELEAAAMDEFLQGNPTAWNKFEAGRQEARKHGIVAVLGAEHYTDTLMAEAEPIASPEKPETVLATAAPIIQKPRATAAPIKPEEAPATTAPIKPEEPRATAAPIKKEPPPEFGTLKLGTFLGTKTFKGAYRAQPGAEPREGYVKLELNHDARNAYFVRAQDADKAGKKVDTLFGRWENLGRRADPSFWDRRVRFTAD